MFLLMSLHNCVVGGRRTPRKRLLPGAVMQKAEGRLAGALSQQEVEAAAKGILLLDIRFHRQELERYKQNSTNWSPVIVV